MNYVYLKWGNRIPAVGVLQKLLNRTGERLVVDGIFGNHTKAAVQRFQRPRGLAVDGIVGQNTWPRVSANAHLPIIDCIDVFDPDLMNLEAGDIRRAGGSPILIGGMSNGVEQAVSDIVGAAGGNVFLLRFHGHGTSGVAGISDGHGLGTASTIAAPRQPQYSAAAARFAAARVNFRPLREIQFMHCSTGRGASGQRLLQQIADGVGVPVTAALRDQLGGGTNTFKFEGPTFTAFPGGNNLRSWCSSRPDFPGFTPA